MQTPLAGVFPIVATPFRSDRSPDVGDLGRVVDFIVESRRGRPRLSRCGQRVRNAHIRRAAHTGGGRGPRGPWTDSAGDRRVGRERAGRGALRCAGARSRCGGRDGGRADADARRCQRADRLLPAHRCRTVAHHPAERTSTGRMRACAGTHRGDRRRGARDCVRQGRNAPVRPADHPAARAGARYSPASSAARADATSPTSLRAAPVARCRLASSSTCMSGSSPRIAPATRPRCDGCSRACCRCSISRRCSAWR